MRIAVCASEGAPYAKSGGLGDVMEALPAALSRIEGNEVVLILPYYNKIKTNEKYVTEQVAQFRVQLGWRQQYAGVYKLMNREDGVTVYFIDNEYYFGGRTGAIYGDMVQHKAFGKGMVLTVTKMGGDALLEIAFDGVGTKKLFAKTASVHMKKL